MLALGVTVTVGMVVRLAGVGVTVGLATVVREEVGVGDNVMVAVAGAGVAVTVEVAIVGVPEGVGVVVDAVGVPEASGAPSALPTLMRPIEEPATGSAVVVSCRAASSAFWPFARRSAARPAASAAAGEVPVTAP